MSRLLAVNSGSTSIKVALLDGTDRARSMQLAGDAAGQLPALLGEWSSGSAAVTAVVHRIVHGGDQPDPVRLLDEAERGRLGDLVDQAPLHQPRGLALADAVGRALPGVPQLAAFDTAFFHHLPPAARTYALPPAWRGEGVRRYGFHGLSHSHARRRSAELLGETPARMVTAHLGGGASLAALREGRPVDTTMGFTPLEGLVMATRSGDVDPGLLVWLLRHGIGVDELEDGLEHGSGLRGLAGTGDMREVAAAAGRGEAEAVVAREIAVHRLLRGIGAMAGVLGGLDVLVFTGGVGEHDHELRSRVLHGLAHLGLPADVPPGDGDRLARGPTATVLVLSCNEEAEMGRLAHAYLSGAWDRGLTRT